jgi:hypothetical protein
MLPLGKPAFISQLTIPINKRPVRPYPSRKFLTGQAPPRRLVCALGAMSLHSNADRRRESMLRRKNKKTLFAAIIVACAAGGIALNVAWATPPVGFTATKIVGPAILEKIDTKSETNDRIHIKSKGLTDVYVTEITIVPGGHGGWHSHPGPSEMKLPRVATCHRARWRAPQPGSGNRRPLR